MTDILSPAERSERMSRIRGKNTRPEIKIRKILHRLGLRYRLHAVNLPGTPDLVFPRFKTIVFVHGCFWHNHSPCKSFKTPKSNTAYWADKFKKNVARDSQAKQALETLGWRVLVVWECELSSAKNAQHRGEKLAEEVRRGKISE